MIPGDGASNRRLSAYLLLGHGAGQAAQKSLGEPSNHPALPARNLGEGGLSLLIRPTPDDSSAGAVLTRGRCQQPTAPPPRMRAQAPNRAMLHR